MNLCGLVESKIYYMSYLSKGIIIQFLAVDLFLNLAWGPKKKQTCPNFRAGTTPKS